MNNYLCMGNRSHLWIVDFMKWIPFVFSFKLCFVFNKKSHCFNTGRCVRHFSQCQYEIGSNSFWQKTTTNRRFEHPNFGHFLVSGNLRSLSGRFIYDSYSVRNIDACSVYLYLSWNFYLTYFFTARVKKTKQLKTALKKVGLFLLYIYIYKYYLLKSITDLHSRKLLN